MKEVTKDAIFLGTPVALLFGALTVFVLIPYHREVDRQRAACIAAGGEPIQATNGKQTGPVVCLAKGAVVPLPEPPK